MSNQIDGIVDSINEAGDLVTDISNESVQPLLDESEVTVKFGPHETAGIHLPDHNEPESTLIAVTGDSGRVEIGIVGMNLAEMLGISSGTKVAIRW